MPNFDFTPLSPDLPEAEREARYQRQNHVKWGVGVARLSKAEVTPAMFRDLQRYIDGELSLDALEALGTPASPATWVFTATVDRARFTQ